MNSVQIRQRINHLKATAYDHISNMERSKQMLETVNAEIANGYNMLQQVEEKENAALTAATVCAAEVPNEVPAA